MFLSGTLNVGFPYRVTGAVACVMFMYACVHLCICKSVVYQDQKMEVKLSNMCRKRAYIATILFEYMPFIFKVDMRRIVLEI